MPIFYAPNILSTQSYAVLNGAMPLEVRVAVLETAVTQLQKQVASLQNLINMVQQAQNHGFGGGGGFASPQILATMTTVIVPFFNAG